RVGAERSFVSLISGQDAWIDASSSEECPDFEQLCVTPVARVRLFDSLVFSARTWSLETSEPMVETHKQPARYKR
ncbi:MAG: hypothetical protein ACI92S_004317, partial [Planctomycetaceae bacterium]